ncbi:MAG: xylulokinase [Deltaproteobacteria bacterium]|jgi:xylulokinase|nr:xylulokinase [Deltaproteobacteria bacterium]
MTSAFLGLDVGTTGIKALAADEFGRIVFSAERPLSLSTPRPAWAEQNPQDWWDGVQALLKDVPAELKIERLGLSGQMHTLVPLDAGGAVVRPAILWCDQRTAAECVQAQQAVGGEARMVELTGNPVYPGFTLPKILWLRNHEPESFKRLKTALIAKDYVAYQLTGEMGSEPSDASGSSMFDVAAGRWSRPVLEALDLDPALLPPLTPSSAARGRLKSSLAQSLRWDRVEVAAGAADNAASALGLGVAEPGDCVVSIGTSGTVLAVTSARVPDGSGRLHFFRHALPESWYLMGVMLSAASCLDWIKKLIAPDLAWERLEAEAAQAPMGADGLSWLPYLQGERTPHRDPHARGVLFGLSSGVGRGAIFRAVMEGVTCGLRDSFELLEALTPIDRVLVVGGGARSRLWRRLLAAHLKRPVTAPAVDQGGAYGAAMLAALGAGVDLKTVRSWATRAETVEPEAKEFDRCDAVHEQHRALYQALKGRFEAAARI